MKLNFFLDALLLLLLGALVGTGALMKRVLIPGREQWEVYGKSGDLSWLGLDRHRWGGIHFVLGGIFLAGVVWHVVRHWGCIRGMFSREGARGTFARAFVFLFLAFCLSAALFPLFIVPTVREPETLGRNRVGTDDASGERSGRGFGRGGVPRRGGRARSEASARPSDGPQDSGISVGGSWTGRGPTLSGGEAPAEDCLEDAGICGPGASR